MKSSSRVLADFVQKLVDKCAYLVPCVRERSTVETVTQILLTLSRSDSETYIINTHSAFGDAKMPMPTDASLQNKKHKHKLKNFAVQFASFHSATYFCWIKW